jgi:uncharacterized protein DUF3105
MSKRKSSQTVPRAARAATAPAPPQAEAAEIARRETDRRAARMERQEAARAAATARRRQTQIRNIGIIAAIVIVVAVLFGLAALREANKPGEYVAMMPSSHIPTAQTPHAAYNSDPPTSGPHINLVPAWGIHDQPIDKEFQLHALEDGGVVINYKPGIDQATLDKLKALTESYPDKVDLIPYPNLSNPIVLTAWTRIQRFDTFDESNIRRFIDAYKGIDHHGESQS